MKDLDENSDRLLGEIEELRRRVAALEKEAAERIVIEQESLASETKFRAAFENACIGIAIVATDGRFMHVNRALCEMVGYSAEELHALTLRDITHPEDA